ncbi:hypothetical protein CLJU_c13500 [Clostridium ljungdahlii DSM 13528]|uniref:Peptide deformylase n=1 Tax=Clostridium ljungdahlii (strain ATCC 55383 / DSM 13528 / PETC) TaxID=748727 RepID=D8GS65_CLOLD|nr:hypothetical protein CLJU_c13500 [Clostridium ljungdahlii DSM 13528]
MIVLKLTLNLIKIDVRKAHSNDPKIIAEVSEDLGELMVGMN